MLERFYIIYQMYIDINILIMISNVFYLIYKGHIILSSASLQSKRILIGSPGKKCGFGDDILRRNFRKCFETK